MPKQTFFFWQGALGEEGLLSTYKTAVNQLLQGDFISADLEKLAHHEVYSFRLSLEARLLFATHRIDGQDYLLLLEDLPTHDYQKSRFLRQGVLRRYLDKQGMALANAVAGEAAAAEPLLQFTKMNDTACHSFTQRFQQPGSTVETEAIPLEYFQHQFIRLNHEQQKAVQVRLPALISGGAGSGKSCVAMSLLKERATHYLQELTATAAAASAAAALPSFLYISESPELVKVMARMWQEQPFADSTPVELVQFKTYDQLMDEQGFLNGATPAQRKIIVGRADFDAWYKHYTNAQQKLARIQSRPFIELSPETVYQEFRTCAAYSLSDYLRLGEKQSLLLEEDQRAWLYAAYKSYLTHVDEEKTLHPSFHDAVWLATFDFVVVDEAQDLSLLQLKRLLNLAKQQAIVYCIDSHQSLHDKRSKRPFLMEMLHASDRENAILVLSTTYRCPPNITRAANEVIKLKQCLAGGIADRNESTHLATATDESVHEGCVDLLSAEEIDTSPWGKSAKGTDFAVITRHEYRQLAMELFNTALVFTPDEIKGLEYDNIVAYQLLDETTFAAIYRKTKQPRYAHTQPQNRAKPGTGDEEFSPFLNAIYTSYTRAKKTLILCETPSRSNAEFLASLRAIATPATVAPSNTAPADWWAEAMKLRDHGNKQQAAYVFTKELNKSIVEFEHFWGEHNPQATPTPRSAAASESVSMATVILKPSAPKSLKSPAQQPSIQKKLIPSPAQTAITMLLKHFTKKQLWTCLQRADININQLSTPLMVDGSPSEPFFCHVMRSADKRQILTDGLRAYPDITVKIAPIDLFKAIKIQGEDAKLIGLGMEEMLVSLVNDNLDLLKKRIVTDWLQKLLKIISSNVANPLLHWLTLSGINLLKELVTNYPATFARIPGSAWAQAYPFHTHPLIITSPLYNLSASVNGRFILQGFIKNKLFVENIPAEAWCSPLPSTAGINANTSVIYWLTATPEGPAILKDLIKIPMFVEKTSGKAWYLPRNKDTGPDENTTPIYWLTATTEGRAILNDLVKNPLFIKTIPGEIWGLHRTKSAGLYEGTSPLYLLAATSEGPPILKELIKAPGFIESIPHRAWSLARPKAAGAEENTSPFYWLTASPESRSILKELIKSPIFVKMIPGEAWDLPLTAAAGAEENASPLYWLTVSSDGQAILKELIKNLEFIEMIAGKAWGLPLTKAAGSNENTSPLYCLTVSSEGRSILTKLIKTPSFISMIPIEAWYLPLTKTAGREENASPLYHLACTPEGQAIVNYLLVKHSGFMEKIPITAWILPLTEKAGKVANTSPLTCLVKTAEGRNVMEQLRRIHQGTLNVHALKDPSDLSQDLGNPSRLDSVLSNAMQRMFQASPILKEKEGAAAGPPQP